MEEDKQQNKIKPIVVERPSTVVETYAEDMATVLENDTGGLVKKIIQGEEAHEAEKRNVSPESSKNKFFLVVSILLVFLGVALVSYFLLKKDTNVVPVAPQFVPIIFNDQRIDVDISGLKKDEIAQAVSNQVAATTVKAGELEGIYLSENKQVIGLRRFIDLIGGHLVPGNDRLLVDDNFLTGVVKNPANPDALDGTGFFILLKVREIADIFDALKAWEPDFLSDLHGFFGIDLSSDTNYLFTKDFADGIVENKNARVLYDKDGKIVLMYILADDNSVVITDSRAAAHEIILRLASSQKKQ